MQQIGTFVPSCPNSPQYGACSDGKLDLNILDGRLQIYHGCLSHNLDKLLKKKWKKVKAPHFSLFLYFQEHWNDVVSGKWSYMITKYQLEKQFPLKVHSDEFHLVQSLIFGPILDKSRINDTLAEGWQMLFDAVCNFKEKQIKKLNGSERQLHLNLKDFLNKYLHDFTDQPQGRTYEKLHLFTDLSRSLSPSLVSLFFKAIPLFHTELLQFFSRDIRPDILAELDENLTGCLAGYIHFKTCSLHSIFHKKNGIELTAIGDFTSPLRTLTGGFGEGLLVSQDQMRVDGMRVYSDEEFACIQPNDDSNDELYDIHRFYKMISPWLKQIYNAGAIPKGKLEVNQQAALLTLATFSSTEAQSNEKVESWVEQLREVEGIDLAKKTAKYRKLFEACKKVKGGSKKKGIWKDYINEWVPAAALLQFFSIEGRSLVCDSLQVHFNNSIGSPREKKRFSWSFSGEEKLYEVVTVGNKKSVQCSMSYPFSVRDIHNVCLISCMIHVVVTVVPTENFRIKESQITFRNVSDLPIVLTKDHLELSRILAKVGKD